MATDTVTPVTVTPTRYRRMVTMLAVAVAAMDARPSDEDAANRVRLGADLLSIARSPRAVQADKDEAVKLIRRRPEIVGYFHGADQPTPF